MQVRMIDLLRNWDKDNSASISPTEFCKALRSYGCPAAESDIRELFDKWDTNGDGEVWRGPCRDAPDHVPLPLSLTRHTLLCLSPRLLCRLHALPLLLTTRAPLLTPQPLCSQLSLLEIHKILRHGGNVRLQRVLKNQPITQKEIRDAQLPPLRKHVPKPVEVLHPSQRPKTVPIVDSDEADRAHKKFQDQAAALHRARLNFASHALQVKPETVRD